VLQLVTTALLTLTCGVVPHGGFTIQAGELTVAVRKQLAPVPLVATTVTDCPTGIPIILLPLIVPKLVVTEPAGASVKNEMLYVELGNGNVHSAKPADNTGGLQVEQGLTNQLKRALSQVPVLHVT
jgi:hypothetical protein